MAAVTICSAEQLMLSNCGAEEDSWESFGQQGDQTPVNPKGNQPWIFIVRTGAEAKASIFWPSDAKSQLTGKDPDAGKDWKHEEKRVTEDEIFGWHHQHNGCEFGQTPQRTGKPVMMQYLMSGGGHGNPL